MTIGLFRDLNLPHEVLKDQKGYNKNLAEEFLNVQLLTKVEAHLIDGNLEKWKLIFNSEGGKNDIFLNLAISEQKVEKYKSTSDVDRDKLDLLLELLWDHCYTVYEFVLSTNYVLQSRDSTYILKKNLQKIIVNIRNML